MAKGHKAHQRTAVLGVKPNDNSSRFTVSTTPHIKSFENNAERSLAPMHSIHKKADESHCEAAASSRICSYDDIPLFLDANDIARLLGLSLTNIYYMFRADDFPTIIIGKRKLVRKEKLLDWISSHEKGY